MIIAGDIGGTKARIGLFERRAGKVVLVVSDQYASREFSSLEEILAKFLAAHKTSITSRLEAACFGLPGPVVNGRIKVTNLPWEVVQSDVGAHIQVYKTKLVNDLVSTAAAVPALEPKSLQTVYDAGGDTDTAGSCALVAPGTGLGHSLLHREGSWSVLLASEGGHANFAPTNDDEIALLKYLQTKLPHVSVESVLCGPGLVNIYSFVRDSYHELLKTDQLALDPSPITASTIANRAIAGSSEIAAKTLSMFCSILGAHCSNIVLTYLSTGGVFLGGGIPPKIAPFLLNGSFVAGYLNKGKLRERVEATPVFIINDDYSALYGAAAIAATL
jgi:glucokinase